jgi:F-type H+-transporting ATPase subunit delta
LISSAVARRYAKALLAIGIDTNAVDKMGEELAALAKIFTENKELTQVLQNPSYSQEKRRAVVVGLVDRLGPSKILRNFLLLLTDRNRIDILADTAVAYGVMVDEHAGRVRAEVSTAQPLTEAQLQRLKEALSKATGKDVILSQETDASLIAGTVSRMGSVVYDGSVRTRMEQLRNALLEGKQ